MLLVLLGVGAGALLMAAFERSFTRSSRTYVVAAAEPLPAWYLDIPNIFCVSENRWEYRTHEIKYRDMPAPFDLIDPSLGTPRSGDDYLTLRLSVHPSVVRDTIETSVEHGRVISQVVEGDELRLVIYGNEGTGRVWASAYQFAEPVGRLERECKSYRGVFKRVTTDMMTGAPIEAYKVIDGREVSPSSASLVMKVESQEH